MKKWEIFIASTSFGMLVMGFLMCFILHSQYEQRHVRAIERNMAEYDSKTGEFKYTNPHLVYILTGK